MYVFQGTIVSNDVIELAMRADDLVLQQKFEEAIHFYTEAIVSCWNT